MKKLLAVCLLMGASAAHAVPVTEPHDISSANPVGYTNFTVTSEGLFTITAIDPAGFGANRDIDPQMYIFANDGDLDASDLIAENDDRNRGNYNSRVPNLFLGLGDYIVAVSNFRFTLAEAISGTNDYSTTGTIDVTIAAGSARQNARQGYTPEAVMTVPEPTSLALLGLGLVAAAGVRRKSMSKI